MRGSITQQGDAFKIVVSAGFDAVTGKRRRVYSRVRRDAGETVKEWRRRAEAELARIVRELDTGTDLEPGRVTVASYMRRWLESRCAKGIRPGSLQRYEQTIRLWISPVIGNVPLTKLRPSHVEAVLDGVRRAGRSPRTVRYAYQTLSAAMRQARRWQLIATNPVEAVEPPRAERKQLAVPSPAAIAALVEFVRDTLDELAVLLLVATGMRRGEALGLRWTAVDLDRGRLRVELALQRVPAPAGGTRLKLVETKTDRARRTIALPRPLIGALRRHRKEQAMRRLQYGEAWIDMGLVLDRGDGGPRDPHAFSAHVRRVLAAAGLPPEVRPHDLRHGFATLLLDQGVHQTVASAVLGHSSTAFTARTYQHFQDSMTDLAARAFEQAVTPTVAELSPRASNGDADTEEIAGH